MVPETRHVQVPRQIMVPVQETIMVPQVRICVRLCVPTFNFKPATLHANTSPACACIHVHHRQRDHNFLVDHGLMHQACVFGYWSELDSHNFASGNNHNCAHECRCALGWFPK
jgi:hypothetical protein